MSHPNVDILRQHLAALSGGDVPSAMSFYAEDCIVHYPGRNELAGTYEGKEAVLGFLGKAMELTEGTFQVEVHDVIGNDDQVVALVSPRATRQGHSLEWNSVDVYKMEAGKIREHRVLEEDQYAVDEFFS